MKELSALEQEVQKSVTKEEKPKKRVQTKLSYKEQSDLDTLPDEIEVLEEEIAALNRCLGDAECYQQKGLAVLSDELTALEKVYEEKSERYFEVLEIFEDLS
jgi:ATP-binding cassette subfamily F protein uup